MRRFLWCGDGGCQTGFARATHGILDVVRETREVAVLAIGYRGDPHDYPYKMYPCWPGGDMFGIGRLPWMLEEFRPDAVMIQQDPWNIPDYVRAIRATKGFETIPIAGAIAVDGKNCKGHLLNGLDLAVFWTTFALDEATKGGYQNMASVVPLGIDLNRFEQRDKAEARARRRLPDVLPRGHKREDAFIVGNVNRNQPRKRLDLLLQYFAEWVHRDAIDNAYLYLHIAPTGDDGYDCLQLARYYGVVDRLCLATPEVYNGDSDDELVDVYNSFDVNATTTQGEGFGLTTFEAMACGVPCIVPDWSALGELAKGAALLVPCTSTIATHSRINSIGGVADKELYVKALSDVYTFRTLRDRLTRLGLERVSEPQFDWRAVGEGFRNALEHLPETSAVADWGKRRPAPVQPEVQP